MTLDELEQCIQLLLRYARRTGVHSVEPGDKDLYWTISSRDWLKIYEEPKPSVGSFADDESELKEILKDPTRACSVDLDRAGSFLRLLSDQVSAHDGEAE